MRRDHDAADEGDAAPTTIREPALDAALTVAAMAATAAAGRPRRPQPVVPTRPNSIITRQEHNAQRHDHDGEADRELAGSTAMSSTICSTAASTQLRESAAQDADDDREHADQDRDDRPTPAVALGSWVKAASPWTASAGGAVTRTRRDSLCRRRAWGD